MGYIDFNVMGDESLKQLRWGYQSINVNQSSNATIESVPSFTLQLKTSLTRPGIVGHNHAWSPFLIIMHFSNELFCLHCLVLVTSIAQSSYAPYYKTKWLFRHNALLIVDWITPSAHFSPPESLAVLKWPFKSRGSHFCSEHCSEAGNLATWLPSSSS